MHNRDHNIKENNEQLWFLSKSCGPNTAVQKEKREKDTWRDKPQETAKCVYKFSKTTGLKGVALMGKA